jgi:demethylmenaquinone methyltransferase/2-methoxy-6-polyprenyl-1,4-benzoquinol methylase
MAAGMLARARTTAPLVRADALALPLRDGSVDGAISGFALRNVVDIGACFDEAARVIRSGGRAVFLEVSEPQNPVLRRMHSLYFRRVVPLVGGLISDRRAYRYLPASTVYLPPPEGLLDLLARSGFAHCRRVVLGAGAAQLLIGIRR